MQPALASGPPDTEHAYSSMRAHPGSTSGVGAPSKKFSMKSGLGAALLQPPIVRLNDRTRSALEELMMEGDLLEVVPLTSHA